MYSTKLGLHFNELDIVNLTINSAQDVHFWNSYKLDSKQWVVGSNDLAIHPDKLNKLKNLNHFETIDHVCYGTLDNSKEISLFDKYSKVRSKTIQMKNVHQREGFIQKYNDLFRELIYMHKSKLPAGTIIDSSTSFCNKCCPLSKIWLDNSNFSKASVWLQKQISFKPDQHCKAMIAVYQRRYKLIFNWFPKGKQESYNATLKYSIKYSKPQFKNCKKELNYRLHLDFETNRLVKLAEFIKSHPEEEFDESKFHWLPLIVIFNSASDSSPLRLCLVPNQIKRFSIPVKELVKHGYSLKPTQTLNDTVNINCSFNDNIIGYSTSLPPILYTHINYLTSTDIIVSDVSDFFKVIVYSPSSAVTQLVELYEDELGKPSIVSTDNYKTKPTTWVMKNQSYGNLDSPSVSQVALLMTPDIFKKFSPLKINDLMLKEITKWLTKIYVDDMAILPHSDYLIKFFIQLPAIISKPENAKTNYVKTCSLCVKPHTVLTQNSELFLPLNCPSLQECKYNSYRDPDNYHLGPYMQHKSGLENLWILLNQTENVENTADITVTTFYEHLYKLNNLQYTKFIKSVTRHYNLLIIYHCQSIINYSGFYFKALLSSDSLLHDILPLLLTKNKEISDAKKQLSHMRPKPEQIREELKSKIVMTKADKKKSKSIGVRDVEFETKTGNVLYMESSEKLNCHSNLDTNDVPVYSGNLDMLVKYSNYLLDQNEAAQKYDGICCYESINSTPDDEITQLGRVFMPSKTPSKSHHIFGNLGLSKKHRSLCLFPNPSRKVTVTCNDYHETENILNADNYYFTKRGFLGLISQLFDISGQFMIVNTMIAKLAWKQICKLEGLDWDDKIPDKYVKIAMCFCKYFFHCVHNVIPRSSMLLHPRCERYLIYMSDAGKCLFGYCIFLLTYMVDENGQVIQGDYINLVRQTFTNIDRYSIELNELYAFSKATFMAQNVHKCLEQEGLLVPKLNIIGASDSTISIFQLRYLDQALFKDIKVRHLCAKVQLLFGTEGMCLIKNIRLWDQTQLPFPPDFLTKLPSDFPPLPKLEQIDNCSKHLDPALMLKLPDNWDHLKIIFKAPKEEEIELIPEMDRLELDVKKFGMFSAKEIDSTNTKDTSTEQPNTDVVYTILTSELTYVNPNDYYLSNKPSMGEKVPLNIFNFSVTPFSDNSLPIPPKMTWLNTNDNSDKMELFQYNWKTQIQMELLSPNKFDFKLFNKYAMVLYFKEKLKTKLIRKQKDFFKQNQLLNKAITKHNIESAVETCQVLELPSNFVEICLRGRDELMKDEINKHKNTKTLKMDFNIMEEIFGNHMGINPLILSVRKLIQNGFDKLKIDKYTTEINYQNYVFKIPYTSREEIFIEDLIIISHLMIFSEKYVETRLAEGCYYPDIKHFLIRFIQLQVGTLCDQLIWEESHYKKYAKIYVKKRTFYLNSEHKLAEGKPEFEGHLAITRQQKNVLSANKIFGPYYNLLLMITEDGPFSNYVLNSIHSKIHLGNTAKHQAIALNQGFFIQNIKRKFNKIKDQCCKCKVLAAVSLNTRYLINKYKMGSSADINNFIRNPQADISQRISIMDLCGPFNYTNNINKASKVWICLFLDLKTHVVTLKPIFSLSSKDLVATVLEYSNNNSSKILFSDNGSNFSGKHPIVNNLLGKYTNPSEYLEVEQNMELPRGLDLESEETRTLDYNSVKSLLYNTKIEFILFASKNHVALNRIETQVGRLKRVFLQQGIYHMLKEGQYSLNQFLLILNYASIIINSRPLLLNRFGQIITPNTIFAYLNQSPYIVDFEDPGIGSMNQICTSISSAIFTNIFLKNLLENNKNYRHKSPGSGHLQTLMVGSIVLDPISFRKTKNYVKSIYKIIFLNSTKSWAIITKPKSLFSNNDKNHRRNPIVLSRACNHLILITNPNPGNVIFIEPPLWIDQQNHTKIEEILLGNQIMSRPLNFMDETQVEVNIELFRNLDPALTSPELGLVKNKTLNVDNISDKVKTNILKNAFLHKNPEYQNIDFDSQPQISDLLNIPSQSPEVQQVKNHPIELEYSEPPLEEVKGEIITLPKTKRLRKQTQFFKPHRS